MKPHQVQYDTLPDLMRPLEKSRLGTFFPSAFTLISGLLFLLPTYLLMKYALNPIAMPWSVGNWAWVLLIIPVTIAVVHYVHVRNGGPHAAAAGLGFLVPPLLLIVFAAVQNGSARKLQAELFSTDCDASAGKRSMQLSWEAAAEVLANCYNETVARHPHSLTVRQLRTAFRIEDCDDYQSQLRRHRRDWTYLKMMEERYYCAGWCYRAPQIWANAPAQDSCSVVAASFFRDAVVPTTLEVVIMTVCTLVISIVVGVFAGPILSDDGND